MGLLSPGQVASMAGLINTQANATVTLLAEPGPISDSGDTDGYTSRWTGTAPALLDTAQEAIEVQGHESGGRVMIKLADLDNQVTLTILDGVAPIIEQAGHTWDGWQVTFQDLRENPAVPRVLVIDRMVREAYGLLDSVTLTLKA